MIQLYLLLLLPVLTSAAVLPIYVRANATAAPPNAWSDSPTAYLIASSVVAFLSLVAGSCCWYMYVKIKAETNEPVPIQTKVFTAPKHQPAGMKKAMAECKELEEKEAKEREAKKQEAEKPEAKKESSKESSKEEAKKAEPKKEEVKKTESKEQEAKKQQEIKTEKEKSKEEKGSEEYGKKGKSSEESGQKGKSDEASGKRQISGEASAESYSSK